MSKKFAKVWKRKGLFIASLMVILLAVAGCGTSTTDATTDKKPAGPQKIQIGSTLALSGVIGPFGKEFSNGVQLALSELNARGGNYTYEYQELDDQYAVPPAVSNVQRLSGQGVKYIIGPMGEQGPAVAKVAKDKKFIFIGAFSDPAVNEIAPEYAFTMSNSASLHGQTAVAYIVKKAYKKVAIIVDSTTYGSLFSTGAATALRKEGIEYTTYVTELGQTDFKAQLTKIKSSGADVLLCGSTYAPVIVQAKQMQELGFKLDLVGGPAVFSDALIAQAGAAVEGTVVFTYDSPSGWQKAKEMQDKYSAKYGKLNRAESTMAFYDVVMMLAQAIEKSSDPNDVDQVSKNLKAITRYDGASGPGLGFESNGFLKKPNTAYKKIQDGKWVVFQP